MKLPLYSRYPRLDRLRVAMIAPVSIIKKPQITLIHVFTAASSVPIPQIVLVLPPLYLACLYI
jgi:hypothetical protein